MDMRSEGSPGGVGRHDRGRVDVCRRVRFAPPAERELAGRISRPAGASRCCGHVRSATRAGRRTPAQLESRFILRGVGTGRVRQQLQVVDVAVDGHVAGRRAHANTSPGFRAWGLSASNKGTANDQRTRGRTAAHSRRPARYCHFRSGSTGVERVRNSASRERRSLRQNPGILWIFATCRLRLQREYPA